jgi:VanZ family protein
VLKTKRPTIRTVLALWVAAVLLVVIGSLLPAATLMRLHYDSIAPNDKIVHFMGYTVLAVVPVALLELLGVGVALAASMIPMGILLEFLQRLVPGRTYEVADMVADSLGVFSGILLALCIRRLFRRSIPCPQSGS